MGWLRWDLLGFLSFGLLYQGIAEGNVLLDYFHEHRRMRMQVSSVLASTTSAVAALTFRPKSAGRHDHFLDEKLGETLGVCLVQLGRVVSAE